MRYPLRNFLGGDRHDHLETHHHEPTRIASAAARRRKPERDCADDACQSAYRREVSRWAEAQDLLSGPLPDLTTLEALRVQTLGAQSAATASERIQSGTVSHGNQRPAGARSRNR